MDNQEVTTNNTPKTLEVLKQLEAGLSQESSSVTAVRIDDPVSAVEESLSEFVIDGMKEVKEIRENGQEIWNEISARKTEANVDKLMDFYLDMKDRENTATATLIGPLTALKQTRIQAEVAAQRQYGDAVEHVVEDGLFKKSTKNILQGITQLNQLLEKIQGNQMNSSITAEIVKEKD